MTTPSPEGLQEPALTDRIGKLLANDPACNGRVTIGTIHAIAAECERTANEAIARFATPPVPHDQGLRDALEPFAAIKMGDDADCKTEIVPNGYSDPMEWRNHIRQARAALTQPEPTARQAALPPTDADYAPFGSGPSAAEHETQQAAGEAEAVDLHAIVEQLDSCIETYDGYSYRLNTDNAVEVLRSALATPQPTETQRIVAWLRHDLDDWPDYVAPADIADALERGEHLAGEGDKA